MPEPPANEPEVPRGFRPVLRRSDALLLRGLPQSMAEMRLKRIRGCLAEG